MAVAAVNDAAQPRVYAAVKATVAHCSAAPQSKMIA
jgi:hypothetical protein